MIDFFYGNLKNSFFANFVQTEDSCLLYKIRKVLNYRFTEIKHLDSTYYLYLFIRIMVKKMEAKLTLKLNENSISRVKEYVLQIETSLS